MVNTINTLTERNKELLTKVEELERKINSFPSREQQLKVLDEIENIAQSLKEKGKKWKKEVGWMWKHKSYRLNTKTFKYHEKQATSEDGEDYSKIFIKDVAFHLWNEEQKRSITEKDNPLESYLKDLIYQYSYMTGRVIHGEEKLAEKVENFEQKVVALRKERKEKETITKEKIEKEVENDELKGKLREKETTIKNLEEKIEKLELMERTHIEAFEVSERWNKDQKIELIKEYNDCVDLLHETDELIEDRDNTIGDLRKDSKERQELLDERDEQNEELRRQLDLERKPLPSLPKKQNKFQQLGTKIKTKFQNLVKKVKHQERELVARIEVNPK